MTEFDKYGNKKDNPKFKRPRNQEDIRYRKIAQVAFEKKLKEVVGDDCTLCFHGTPI